LTGNGSFPENGICMKYSQFLNIKFILEEGKYDKKEFVKKKLKKSPLLFVTN
jgi:hypothetical protein